LSSLCSVFWVDQYARVIWVEFFLQGAAQQCYKVKKKKKKNGLASNVRLQFFYSYAAFTGDIGYWELERLSIFENELLV